MVIYDLMMSCMYIYTCMQETQGGHIPYSLSNTDGQLRLGWMTNIFRLKNRPQSRSPPKRDEFSSDDDSDKSLEGETKQRGRSGDDRCEHSP